MTPPSCRRDHLELGGHGVGQDRQRVVPSRRERVGQTREHARVGVVDRAGLAVQQFGSTVDGAAERHPDRLVPEAHAQQRGARRGARMHQRDGRAGPLRRARSGAEQHTVEFLSGAGDISFGGQAVVVIPPHLGVHSELAEVLDQVEHEAVVIVDHQDLHPNRLPSADSDTLRLGPLVHRRPRCRRHRRPLARCTLKFAMRSIGSPYFAADQ